MTEKRYFERKLEEEYYIFDSQVISEKEFDEKVEYEDYQAFADSMTGEEVTDRLNKYNKEYLDCHNDVLRLEKENEQLKERNKELKELVIEVDNELEIRDTVCMAGKFRLDEWGKHRYHQFYKGDEELEDETVVIILMELEKENKELKTFKDKVFEVIDNHILEETDLRKECIENGSHYTANISRNIIDTLKLIKKELSE